MSSMPLTTRGWWFTAFRNERCIYDDWSTRQQMAALVEVEETVPQVVVTVYEGRCPRRLIYKTGEAYGYLTGLHLKGA